MNNYDVQRVVGEGSFGRAVLCKRKRDQRSCIVKQISLAKLSKKEAKLTEQEAMLLGKLQHPNIVTFWESFVSGNQLHIVMEYADGGDLETHVRKYCTYNRVREIPEAHVVNLFVQICLAIKYIHDRKILHRDLKSQNIFLTSAGICKLGDFGVSKVLRSTVDLAATQIGTPYYMSPEIMTNQRYNSKTDIWSLGVILYEMATQKMPFQGGSMKQLCNAIMHASPAMPSSNYSSDLRHLISDLLIKDPKKRPGINNILNRTIIKDRIRHFLDENRLQREFSHTVLHGQDVMRAMATQLHAPGAPPSAPMPPVAPVVAPPAGYRLMAMPPMPPMPPAPAAMVRPAPVIRPPAPAPVPVARAPMPPSAPPCAPAPMVRARDESVEAMMRRILAQGRAAGGPVPAAGGARKPAVPARPSVLPYAQPKAAANVRKSDVKPEVKKPMEQPAGRRQSSDAVVRPAAPAARPSYPAVPPPAPQAVNPFQDIARRPPVAPKPVPIVRPPFHIPLPDDLPPAPAPAPAAKADVPSSAGPIRLAPNGAERMKAVDQAVDKAAAVLEVIRKEKERYERRTPMPPAPPALAPAPAPVVQVASDVNQVPKKVIPLGTWLGNLKAQMGNLQQQVQHIQAAKAPAVSPPPPPPPPAHAAMPTAAVREKASPEPWFDDLQLQMGNLKQQVKQIQAARSPVPTPPSASPVPPPQPVHTPPVPVMVQRDRQSFPIAKGPVAVPIRPQGPLRDLGNGNDAKRVLTPPTVEGRGLVPRAKGQQVEKPKGKRLSDPPPARVVVKKEKPKPVSPVPVVSSKEELEHRKEVRDKHRQGFKEFLQAQKAGKKGSPGGEDDQDEEEETVTSSADSASTPTPAPSARDLQREALRNAMKAHKHAVSEEAEVVIATPTDPSGRERMLQKMQRMEAREQAAAQARQQIGGQGGKKGGILAGDEEDGPLARSMLAELDEEALPLQSQEEEGPAMDMHLDDMLYFDEAQAEEAQRRQSDFLGQSFLLQYHAEHEASNTTVQLMDAQTALEYSLMLDQMQGILDLPVKAKLPSIDEEGGDGETDDAEEEVEEGFEEESLVVVSEDDDEDIEEEGEQFLNDDDDDQCPAPTASLDPVPPSPLIDLNIPSVSEVAESYDSVALALLPGGGDEADRMDRLWQTVVNTDAAVRPPIDITPVPEEEEEEEEDQRAMEDEEEEDEESSDVLPHEPTQSDPFEDTLHHVTLPDTLQAYYQQNALRPPTRADVLTRRLMDQLGVDKLGAAMQILSSTLLEDDATDEDQLIAVLEQVLGAENLGCLQDMFELLTC